MPLWVEKAFEVTVCLIFSSIGLIIVSGVYKGWPGLVDPPMKFWMFNSQAAIKKLFGRKVLFYYTYFAGWAMVLVSILIAVLILTGATP